MSNIVGGIVVLSVNHEGRVSLWDSPRKAEEGKEDGEIVVDMELTDGQLRIIGRAQERAGTPKRRQGF